MASPTAAQPTAIFSPWLPSSSTNSWGSPLVEQAIPPWLKRWVLVAVAVLTVVSSVTPFFEEMPANHRVAVPIASAITIVVWTMDLLAGTSWSRRLLIAVVVMANVWLTAMGHISNNYLLLTLLVGWAALSGSRSEGLVTLVLSLATFVFSALVSATGPGQLGWTPLTSWCAGAVGIWLMALLFVRQGRLVAELQRLGWENAALNEQAQQAAVLEERQRLARELHDSVTQSLYGISLQAEVGVRALADGDSEPVGASFHEIRETTQEAQAEMRLLLYELRPPLLEEHGLVAALQARLEAVEGRAGLRVRFHSNGEVSLPADVEHELYRIAQEALNNVVKHAHASHVSVNLACDERRAFLEVVDDGLGFKPEPSKGGHGLRNMRERAQLLGGSLQVKSSPGSGTRLEVELPR